jgi:hypothetical protein
VKTITYSLRAGEPTSARYYVDVRRFADEILERGAGLLPIADALAAWVRERENRDDRPDEPSAAAARGATGRRASDARAPEEHLVEALTLGTLWRVYGERARRLTALPATAMEKLYQLRQGHRRLKPAVDALRGIGCTLHLAASGDDRAGRAPDLDELDLLVRWAAATGDLEHEARRLALWRDFLEAHAPAAPAVLAELWAFAEWFEFRAEELLGRYTEAVGRFRRETAPDHRFREDCFLVDRRRVEYHLGMVGAEILNRVYRAEFLATAKKAVLAPSCMRAKQDGCRALVSDDGIRCTHCVPGCRVSALVRRGEREGFRVIVIAHGSQFGSWTRNPELRNGVGMVGVACVLNLLGGGWQAKAAGIPAQCVLLDGCGCRAHWDEAGVSTAIDPGELSRILRDEPAPDAETPRAA